MNKVFDSIVNAASASVNLIGEVGGAAGGAVASVGGAVASVGGTVADAACVATSAAGGLLVNASSTALPVILDFAKALAENGVNGCITVADITADLAKRGINIGNAVVEAAAEAAKYGWDVATSPPAREGYKFLGYATLAGLGVYAVYVVATAVITVLPYVMLCTIAYACVQVAAAATVVTLTPAFVVYAVK